MGEMWRSRCWLCGSVVMAVGVFFLSICYNNVRTTSDINVYTVFTALTCLLCFFVSLIFYDIQSLDPANSHTMKTILTQYLMLRLIMIFGKRLEKRLGDDATNIAASQNSILMKILRKASSTEYGRKYAFNDIHTREQFISKVPLSTYSNYASYMERLLSDSSAKDQQLLTAEPVEYLGMTSGSTGKCKAFPFTDVVKQTGRKTLLPLMIYNDLKRCGLSLGRVLSLSYSYKENRAESGVRCGSINAFAGKTVPYFVSPSLVYALTDEQAAIHLHAVFGLLDNEVVRMDALFSSLIYMFWKHVEHHWRIICDEIETGLLSMTFNDKSLYDMVDRTHANGIVAELRKKANPTRAEELRTEFSKGFIGIASRIWPRFRSVRGVNTGSFVHYGKALQDIYMAGVPQVTVSHVATEGFLGTNLPLSPPGVFTPLIQLGFFEFIPESFISDDTPKTLFADQVKLGGLYELVYTSQVGLYRYRIGDVIRVVDFYYQCPVYRFEYRSEQVLNILGEKVSEIALYRSIDQVIEQLNDVQLIDFTATESLFTPQLIDPEPVSEHYVIFLELRRQNGEELKLSEQQQSLFDEQLLKNCEVYYVLRGNGTLSTARVVQVKPHTFEKLRSSRACGVQYKLPRVTRKQQDIDFLIQNCQSINQSIRI